MIKWPTHSHITGSRMTSLHYNRVGRGILAHHPSGPQHYIASLGDCMFVSCMELDTCSNQCFVKVGFRNWPPHMDMSHTYVPTHATATPPPQGHTHASQSAPAPAHTTAHTDSGSTCVAPKWSIPLDIRPSNALPLCACGTPMHLHPNLLHCAEGSNHVTHSF
ncbi:hypothetical protein O181_003687 [Austropuccinia psidii MF-1]|uniref:Uncharacterized protein n=1 Tax=Austropuccinia psidii MF-1 TaxID=1389203 RepID=A0A9Q3BET9_9BASI|nr:hypothetical protein [Austropuccinia psidii MF-1]